MFECFRFFDIRDAHNGSVKDGGQEAYLFRHLLGYGLQCEENHEKWKVEANPPWITPILASIYPFTQRRWPPKPPPRKGYRYHRARLMTDILYIPLAMFWVDLLFTDGFGGLGGIFGLWKAAEEEFV